MFIIIPSMAASAFTTGALFSVIIVNNMVAALLLGTAADLMNAFLNRFPAAVMNTMFLGFAAFVNPLRVLYTMNAFNVALTIQKFLSYFRMTHTWLELGCMAMVVYTAPRMSINRRVAVALVVLSVASMFEVGYLHLPNA